MARMRTIKPGFFANEVLCEVEPLGRILFAGLWGQADREGRLEDRPKRLKAAILPYDDADADDLLVTLSDRGFIQRYAVDGVRYIQVLNFKKHQNPHVKEPPSTIPAPPPDSESTGLAPDEHSASTVLAPYKNGATHPPCPADHGSLTMGHGDQGTGTGDTSPQTEDLHTEATARATETVDAVRAFAFPKPGLAPGSPQVALSRALAASLDCSEPTTKSERARWAEAIREMLHATPPVSQGEIPRLVNAFRERYTVPCTPQSLVNHLSQLRADEPVPRANGHGAKPSNLERSAANLRALRQLEGHDDDRSSRDDLGASARGLPGPSGRVADAEALPRSLARPPLARRAH